MTLSLNQAAKMCGRAKSTILDAIRSGKLSAPKDGRGHYNIDPAELHRVFPFKSPEHQEPVADHHREPQPTPAENHPNTVGLEREINLLREMLEKSENNAENWRHMAERQQAQLEDKRPKGFFKRLLGR